MDLWEVLRSSCGIVIDTAPFLEVYYLQCMKKWEVGNLDVVFLTNTVTPTWMCAGGCIAWYALKQVSCISCSALPFREICSLYRSKSVALGWFVGISEFHLLWSCTLISQWSKRSSVVLVSFFLLTKFTHLGYIDETSKTFLLFFTQQKKTIAFWSWMQMFQLDYMMRNPFFAWLLWFDRCWWKKLHWNSDLREEEKA